MCIYLTDISTYLIIHLQSRQRGGDSEGEKGDEVNRDSSGSDDFAMEGSEITQ